jgi:hypothetical protein
MLQAAASTRIQALYRGYRSRCEVEKLRLVRALERKAREARSKQLPQSTIKLYGASEFRANPKKVIEQDLKTSKRMQAADTTVIRATEEVGHTIVKDEQSFFAIMYEEVRGESRPGTGFEELRRPMGSDVSPDEIVESIIPARKRKNGRNSRRRGSLDTESLDHDARTRQQKERAGHTKADTTTKQDMASKTRMEHVESAEASKVLDRIEDVLRNESDACCVVSSCTVAILSSSQNDCGSNCNANSGSNSNPDTDLGTGMEIECETQSLLSKTHVRKETSQVIMYTLTHEQTHAYTHKRACNTPFTCV